MHRLARLLAARRIAALAATLAITLPGLAAANTSFVTITFENGYFDPNPPPGIQGTPAWYQAGALYEGFWFDDAGSPAATSHPEVHTHLLWDDRALSIVDNPHSWRDGMQGARISLLDSSEFRVVSIDYRLHRRLPLDGEDPNSQFARLPWSYDWADAQLLLSDAVDPATPDFASFEAQWTAFSIDDGSQYEIPGGGGATDPWRPSDSLAWQTLQVTGFAQVTEFYIGSTAHGVGIDNIVIEPLGGGSIPEPGTATLLGMGLALLCARRHPRQPTA